MVFSAYPALAPLWPHGHPLAPDRVFYEADAGRVRFVGVGPPRDQYIQTVAPPRPAEVRMAALIPHPA